MTQLMWILVALLGTYITIVGLSGLGVFILYFPAWLRYKPPSQAFKGYLPKLTVIIPVYNEELTLRSCIEALVANPYGNDVEVLIVNDGSTDATLEIARELAEEYAFIYVISDGQNKGKAQRLLEGVQIANGGLIAILDADVQIPPNALSVMAKTLMANSSISAVQPDIVPVIRTKEVGLLVKLMNHKLFPHLRRAQSSLMSYSLFGCGFGMAKAADLRKAHILLANDPWYHPWFIERDDNAHAFALFATGGTIVFQEEVKVAQLRAATPKAFVQETSRHVQGRKQKFRELFKIWHKKPIFVTGFLFLEILFLLTYRPAVEITARLVGVKRNWRPETSRWSTKAN
jgi:glycosyltransferase involved in cell wall biosynthesis